MSRPTALPAIAWRPARFWHREGARVVCDLCPFRCALAAGALGRCRVRRRTGDALETATRASSVWHWQPMERKPFYHFRPGGLALTLAAPGCTFRCDYCQNAPLSQYGRDPAAVWGARPLVAAEVAAAAEARGAVVALSYSEPVLAAELTLELAAAGATLLWKSNGFVTAAALAQLAPCLAAANIDLKAGDESRHRALTGAPLGPVLDTIAALRTAGVWVEVSTPLITGFNTDPRALRRLAQRLAGLGRDIPWHLLRVHPDYRRPQIPPTAPALLAEAVAIGRAAGLRFVYVARALGAAGAATRCPACARVLLEREQGRLTANRLDGGRCPGCGEPIPGSW